MITTHLGLLSLFLTICFTVVGGILSYIGLLGGGFCPGGILSGYRQGTLKCFWPTPKTLSLAHRASIR